MENPLDTDLQMVGFHICVRLLEGKFQSVSVSPSQVYPNEPTIGFVWKCGRMFHGFLPW